MGGMREDVIDTGAGVPATGKSRGKKNKAVDVEAGSDTQSESIRVHENNGEVHFHVDAEKLKVAIPAADWWKAWEKLSNAARQGEAVAFDYVDEKNGTILVAKTLLKEEDGGMSYSLNAELKVRRLAGTNSIFQQLKKFTEAKG